VKPKRARARPTFLGPDLTGALQHSLVQRDNLTIHNNITPTVIPTANSICAT